MNKLKPYSGELPIYCWCCGRKLIHKQYFRKYDENTGEKLYNTKVYCPAFWNIFKAHTNLKFDHEGYEIIDIDYSY